MLQNILCYHFWTIHIKFNHCLTLLHRISYRNAIHLPSDGLTRRFSFLRHVAFIRDEACHWPNLSVPEKKYRKPWYLRLPRPISSAIIHGASMRLDWLTNNFADFMLQSVREWVSSSSQVHNDMWAKVHVFLHPLNQRWLCISFKWTPLHYAFKALSMSVGLWSITRLNMPRLASQKLRSYHYISLVDSIPMYPWNLNDLSFECFSRSASMGHNLQ
jgi:hypothetical protein